MERAEVFRTINRVVVAATAATSVDALVLTTDAILDAVNNRVSAMPEYQRTVDNCIIRFSVLAQLYEKRGIATFPDGRPRFEPGVDIIIGPIEGREFVVKAETSQEKSGLLNTNKQGIGIDPKTQKDYLQFSGRGEIIGGRPQMWVSNKDQQSGNSIVTPVTCGNQFNDQEYIHKGRADIKLGQGPTVLPRGTEIITTPAATSEARRVEATPTAREAITEANRVNTAIAENVAKAVQEALAKEKAAQAAASSAKQDNPVSAAVEWATENKWPVGVVIGLVALAIRPTRRIIINSIRLPDRAIRRWRHTYASPLWP